jgi:ComF family protein
VRAAVAYGPVPRALALGLKYGRRTGYAATAARLMRRHVPDDAELLVPVPLHRWRLWARGYNQAGLIAAELARSTGVPLDRSAIERVRATQSLRGLSPAQRRRAVNGAFRLRAEVDVAGRHVVLVDDVHTSGATSDGCVAVLLADGAARVTVLAWARVLDDGQAD